MPSSSFERDLLDLGFSPHDAVVYGALLEKGPCGAGAIISATSLHRNIVYTSLAHLAARKLVMQKKVRGRKEFLVAWPDTLVEEFVQKSALAQELSKTIAGRLNRGEQEITVHQGNQEYLNILTSTIRQMPKGSTKYVLGTGGEAFMRTTMLPIWDAYHAVAHAQGIRINMIGYEPQRKAVDPSARAEKIYRVRYLPANLENPSGIHIYPEAETVLNIIYSDDVTPVTAIRIKNKALTQGYLNLFQNLWKMGKE